MLPRFKMGCEFGRTVSATFSSLCVSGVMSRCSDGFAIKGEFSLSLSPGGIHSPGFESGDTLSCQSLMNADGLYLVSYYSLLLNLKLCCCDYYRRRTLTPVLSLVSRVPDQFAGVLNMMTLVQTLKEKKKTNGVFAHCGIKYSPPPLLFSCQ